MKQFVNKSHKLPSEIFVYSLISHSTILTVYTIFWVIFSFLFYLFRVHFSQTQCPHF